MFDFLLSLSFFLLPVLVKKQHAMENDQSPIESASIGIYVYFVSF